MKHQHDLIVKYLSIISEQEQMINELSKTKQAIEIYKQNQEN